jgi:hypothetical protein
VTVGEEGANSSCAGFRVRDGVENRSTILAQVSLSTDIDGGFLSPGTAYYVRVSAKNDVGTGPPQMAVPTDPILENVDNSLAPQAPPGLPTNVRVLANADNGESLLVEWDAVDTDNGAPVSQYTLEYTKTASFAPMAYHVQEVDDWLIADSGLQIFTAEQIAVADRAVATRQVNSEMTEAGSSWSDAGVTYAANLTNLTCGIPIVVRVRAHNRRGPGGPIWYTEVGRDDAQLALPVCADGIEDCVEPRPYGWSIIPRPVVNKPPFVIPLAGTISSGAGTDVEAKNSFTKNSLMVTFGIDSNATYCDHANVTKWKVEWDTAPTFDSLGTGAPLSYNKSLNTSPEVEDRGDGEGKLGMGFYNITGLAMGTRYFVRVTAFNSLGYGEPADYVDAVPCVSPDPPGIPTSMSRISLDSNKPSEQMATSLQVKWTAPFVSEKFEDDNGNGGDAITKYAVEWSRRPFTSFNKTIQTITVRCPGVGARLSGRIRLLLNTSSMNVPASLLLGKSVRTGLLVDAIHVSTDIEIDSSAHDLQVILQNMINIGAVSVERSEEWGINGSVANWTVAFDGDVGPIPLLERYSQSLECICTRFQGGGCTEDEADVSIDYLDASGDGYAGPGSVPQDSRYRFQEVPVLPDDGGGFALTITELTPGETYYSRVVARNRLGYGHRRLTTPIGPGSELDGGVKVPFLKPDPPLSTYYRGG